jgi:hypothetical protein
MGSALLEQGVLAVRLICISTCKASGADKWAAESISPDLGHTHTHTHTHRALSPGKAISEEIRFPHLQGHVTHQLPEMR